MPTTCTGTEITSHDLVTKGDPGPERVVGNFDGASPLSSLAKGLAALNHLWKKGELGTNELSDLLHINKSAASRILQTLASAGYANRVAGRRYRLSERLTLPVSPVTSVRPSARPLMEQLAQETNESVYLGLFVDGQVLYVDKIVPERTLKVDRPIPTFSPLYCTAIGKVFVAFNRVPLPSILSSYTDKTITDLQEYAKQLQNITQEGYAWDDEEFNIGVRCIASPLFDDVRTVVAVLCLAVPTARLPTDQIGRYGMMVRAIAAKFTY